MPTIGERLSALLTPKAVDEAGKLIDLALTAKAYKPRVALAFVALFLLPHIEDWAKSHLGEPTE